MNKKSGKIIIADDEHSMRDFLTIIVSQKFPYLKQEFYTTGSELEERLKQSPNDVRVVLTDNHMKQGRDGEELIKLYSKNSWKRVPMILHTGDRRDFSEESSENLFGYLNKPCKPKEIYSMIESALNYYDEINSGNS